MSMLWACLSLLSAYPVVIAHTLCSNCNSTSCTNVGVPEFLDQPGYFVRNFISLSGLLSVSFLHGKRDLKCSPVHNKCYLAFLLPTL